MPCKGLQIRLFNTTSSIHAACKRKLACKTRLAGSFLFLRLFAYCICTEPCTVTRTFDLPGSVGTGASAM